MTGVRTADEMRALYDRSARHYDTASFFYRLSGIEKMRSELIASMALPLGATVVDLGTGTGANLKQLSEMVGKDGRVIGVDMSPKMLAIADRKTQKIENVELIESNVQDYKFPDQVDGIISTFALEFVPAYPDVIENAAIALSPGKPFALMGLKYPEDWPLWLADIGIWFNRSFGVTRAYRDFKPWIAADEYCQAAIFKELYYGSTYMWLGSRSRIT